MIITNTTTRKEIIAYLIDFYTNNPGPSNIQHSLVTEKGWENIKWTDLLAAVKVTQERFVK